MTAVAWKKSAANNLSGQTTWTGAEDDIAKALWKQGYSADQIAKKLPGRSRNAVIGRIHRLGLSDAGRGKLPTPRPTRAPAVSSHRAAPPKPGQQNRPGSVFGKVSIANPEETERKRQACQAEGERVRAGMAEPANDTAVPLIERGRFQCSWPVGEPPRPAEQMCCGMPVPEGANPSVESYCAKHAQRAVSRTLVGGKPDAKVYERSLRRFA